MTAEEVIAEMVGYLAQRQSPKDDLVPMGNFLAMLGGPDRAYPTRLYHVLRGEGGHAAVEAYRAAYKERRRSYEADLVAASAEGKPLAHVAQAYGHTSGTAYNIAERLTLATSRPRIERARLVEVARRGMTIRQLAVAAGYKADSLRNWVRYGHLKELFVLRKDKSNVYRIVRVRDED